MKKRKGFFGFFIVLGTFIVGGSIFVLKKLEKLNKTFGKLAIFSSDDIKYDEDKQIEDIAGIFSSLDIDLTNVNITEDEISLKVLSLFSNLTIKVPKNWKVIVEGHNKFSNVEVNVSDDKDEKDNNITLNINYDIRFSNVNIIK